MPVKKNYKDYVEPIQQALKEQHHIVISKQRIERILKCLNNAIIDELIDGKIVMMGTNVEDSCFIHKKSGRYPRVYHHQLRFFKYNKCVRGNPVDYILTGRYQSKPLSAKEK